MGKTSLVDWTKSSYNHWRLCSEVSPACAPCYARVQSHRFGYSWGEQTVRIRSTATYQRQPLIWNERAASSATFWPVFAFSYADVFDNWKDTRTEAQIQIAQDQARSNALAYHHPRTGNSPAAHTVERLVNESGRMDLQREREVFFDIVENTRSLTWQLLTKRAHHIAEMVPPSWLHGDWPQQAWLGVTTETSAWASMRLVFMHHLRSITNVPLVFCSVEPMFEQIDFRCLPKLAVPQVQKMLRAVMSATEALRYAELYDQLYNRHIGSGSDWNACEAGAINWVITGGQSGGSKQHWLVDSKGHLLPEAADNLRHMRSLCAEYDIAWFHKQHGGSHPAANGRELDGREHVAFPTSQSV